MSWSEMKSAVNSTVGTGAFTPLDKLIKESLDKYFYENLVMCSMIFLEDGEEKLLVVPPGTEKIEDSEYSRKKYAMVVLPSSVKIIGDAAFWGTPVRTINLPDGLTSIGSMAFKGCDLRYGINIPEGIKIIERETFQDSKLRSIELPNSVEEIGEWAFVECPLLHSVKLGKNIKKINLRAFRHFDIDSDNPTQVQDVYYAGTEEEWSRVEGNNAIGGATIHYNS